MVMPTYDQWMSDTKRGIFTPRSKQLEAVDAALKDYYKVPAGTPQKLTALKNALNAWIAYKGPGWRTSTRNTNGIVAQLYAALFPGPIVPKQAAPVPPIPNNPVPGDFYLAPSFSFANTLARNEVPKALKRAKLLVDVAYRKIAVAKRGPGEDRDTYVTWFGAFDQARITTVMNNLKTIYDALWLKPVVLYYRGNNVSGPSDCAAEPGNLAPENFFGAAWKPPAPATLDQRFTYIFLGKAFFTSGVYDNDSIGGVIIHELTHAMCGTDDVVHNGQETYGEALCQQLALDRPDLAIKNADSYEYLCENYQNKLYKPSGVTLNLPAKASINLNLHPL